MQTVRMIGDKKKEHEPCNSDCPTCTARKTCRWNPDNLGKKYKRDPPSPWRERNYAAARHLKAIKCADGKKRKFFNRKLLNKLPGKWQWRFLCECRLVPCYHSEPCILCVEERFPGREILWSNKEQAYILKELPHSSKIRIKEENENRVPWGHCSGFD